MKHILFFGDSLTAGYGLRDVSTESFPALIQQKINSENLPYQVTNAGISGDTSAGGLARIDYWTSRAVDVFILELGINDVMRGISPATTLKNLQSIIEKVKARYPNAKLALMGMQLPGFVPGLMTAEFHSIFNKLAVTYQMTFVPFFLEGVMGFIHLPKVTRLLLIKFGQRLSRYLDSTTVYRIGESLFANGCSRFVRRTLL